MTLQTRKKEKQLLAEEIVETVRQRTAELAIWLMIIIWAAKQPRENVISGEKVILNKGQMIVGTDELISITDSLGITEADINKILGDLEMKQQISIKSWDCFRLITVKMLERC